MILAINKFRDYRGVAIYNNVSIVIPHFNGSSFIEETLKSATKSISARGEIIVVDDGSHEDEYKHLTQTVERMKNPSIRLIRHRENRGGAAARNTGVRASKNNWIFNLDADNLIREDLICQLLDFAVTNHVDVACPATIHFFKEQMNEISHEWVFVEREITFLDHLRSPYVPSSSGNYLFSRAAFEKAGGFPEFAGGLDAWGFGLSMVAAGSKMRVCPTTSYFHRFGHESYYVRESRRTEKHNLIATSLVLEYPDLCSSRIIQKLLGRPHRISWFSKIQDNPLRIQGQAAGKVVNH